MLSRIILGLLLMILTSTLAKLYPRTFRAGITTTTTAVRMSSHGLGAHSGDASDSIREVMVCGKSMRETAEVKALVTRRRIQLVEKESTEFKDARFDILWSAHRGLVQIDSNELEIHFLGGKQLPSAETVDLWDKKLSSRLQRGGMSVGNGGLLQKELDAAYSAVHRASYISRSLQKSLLSGKGALNKEDKSPVTIADFVVQALVISELAALFPHDKFIAEESSDVLRDDPVIRNGVKDALVASTGMDWSLEDIYSVIDRGQFNGTAERVWVLDPVDGTKGFMRGEHYCVALSLLVHSKPTVSVLGCPNLSLQRALEGPSSQIAVVDAPVECGAYSVHPPTSGSIYFAVTGQGAYARALSMDSGAAIEVQVSFKSDVREVVMCEAAEAAHGNRGVTAALATSLGFGDKFVRLDGQCKYCLVGAGAADGNIRLPPLGYLEKIWDHAAGSHFVREAGGRVTDLQDNELDFSLGRDLPEGVRGVLSSNGILHRKFLDGIKATYEEGLKSGQIKRKYLDP